MRTREVKAFEIPVHLLAQKKTWDLQEFFVMALVVDHWYGYLFSDADVTDCAAMILYDDALYDEVGVQTVIVDKAFRTPERVAAVLQEGYRVLREKARERGRKYISVSMRTPEKYLEMLGNPDGAEILETRVRQVVGG